MPRITRAALRTNAILEDEANLAAATPLPSTPTMSRTPLGEVAVNMYGETVKGEDQDDAIKPAKKAVGKARRAKGTKKGRKKDDDEKENQVEILEDPYQSSASSAVEEACEDLLKKNAGGKPYCPYCVRLFRCSTLTIALPEMHQIPIHDPRPRTPPSKAVQAALKQLSSKSHTPRFNPEVHKTPRLECTPGTSVEDSFIGTIGTRTPAPVTHGQSLSKEILDKPTTEELIATKDDSFIEDIVTRSPIKDNMGIVDTVEAIDALEEAIEKITESIPIIIEDRLSPVKTSHVEKKIKVAVTRDQSATSNLLTTKKSTASSGRVKRTTAVKNATPGNQRKAPIKRSPFKAIKTTKVGPAPRITAAKLSLANNSPLTPKLAKSSTNTTAVASTTKTTVNTTGIQGKRARVSSISNAPFVPQRSTKAPTRPTFTLPGDAISQRLKAQREERLKREEEEISKKREFKARPVRVSLAPVVKGTAASRARISLMRGEGSGGSASVVSRKEGAEVKVAKTAPRVSSTSSTVTNLNGHSIANTKRVSVLPNITSQVRANISAPRAPSLALSSRGTATLKGKEVFGRVLAEQEARDAARKEKEEAAKKARAEAAERGRIASREWAEKMKARKERERGSAGVAA
ncbi:hypothetical protein MMC11_008584 [Xylographa trunciseda]|nr:hypothetical protein [Xylographa trunciseda]